MECNLVWNHTRDFKIGHARIATSIWNHKYEFRPKFGNTNFNYHFIRAILKSQNPVSTNIMLIHNSRLAGLLKINLKSKAWFQMKIARYLVQLPLHYNRFEIAESSQHQFFVFKTEMVRFRTEMMWFKTWMIWFWTDVI